MYCHIVKAALDCRTCVSTYSPAIVANLWDVTDEDIDRYCECLLDNWLSGSEEPLLKHASSARSVCKLKYLIGASPVVYGIPVCTSGVSPKAAA